MRQINSQVVSVCEVFSDCHPSGLPSQGPATPKDDGEKENVEHLFCRTRDSPPLGFVLGGGKVYVLFSVSGCAGCHFATLLLSTPPDTHIHKICCNLR